MTVHAAGVQVHTVYYGLAKLIDQRLQVFAIDFYRKAPCAIRRPSAIQNGTKADSAPASWDGGAGLG
jgi:hypothetical protein